MEMGAATFHPHTIMSVLDSNPAKIAFMQPCRRPQDGRAGQSGNRLYKHSQFQVIMMPPPHNIQEMVVNSLYECGIDPNKQNIDFVENNWNSPSLGAAGKGYEVNVNGNEVLQFTYFQQIAGCDLGIIPVELAYGIERLSMMVQGANHFYNMRWDHHLTYGQVNSQLEHDNSKAIYNPESLKDLFDIYMKIIEETTQHEYMIPSYEVFLKLSHTFNLIENAGQLSVNERVSLMSKMRQAATLCLSKFVKNKNVSIPYLPPKSPQANLDFNKVKQNELFVEIMVEKVPSNHNVGELFSASVANELKQYSNTKGVKIQTYVSCQRMILSAKSFPNYLIKSTEDIKGPKVGVSEEVVEKFLAKHNKTRDQLKTKMLKGDEFYYLEASSVMFHIKSMISEMVHNILANMPCPEYMRWTDGFQWIRPIRRLVIMYNEEYILAELPWIKSSPSSLYVLTERDEFIYNSADTYFRLLEERGISVREFERKNLIKAQINSILEKENLVLLSQSNEVVKQILLCTESPTIYLAEYSDDFELPAKIREMVMVCHQKFVPLFTKDGSLSNKFLLHSNYELNDGGKQLIKDAGEILRSRFQEAEYFWKKDAILSYEKHSERLRKSTFYEGLGSLNHQTNRLEFMVSKFFPQVEHLEQAARFLNLDLCMNTVFEIPELHGTASGIYSTQICNQDPMVEEIIINSIYPKNEAPLPKNLSRAGAILGFCVRLDQLVGFLGKGCLPRGSSDQFGLRRAAFGLVRLGYSLRDLPDLNDLIKHSIELYANQDFQLSDNTHEILLDFLQKRALVLLSGISSKLAPAFISSGGINWHEDLKLKAFMSNENTHSELIKTYNRLSGICKNQTEVSPGTKWKNQYAEKLSEYLNKLNKVEYSDLLQLSKRIAELLDKVHISSLEAGEKEYVLGLLLWGKRVFDDYCCFGAI